MDFEVIPLGRIAQGTFGEISLALRKEIVYALKTPFNNDRSEMDILQDLSYHPHIVRLKGKCTTKGCLGGDHLSFVLEYCPVDLHFALEWRRLSFQPLLSMKVIRTIMMQTLSALVHVHKRGYLHGDIKPGNLLVHAYSGTIQLSDFGLATKVGQEKSGTMNGLCTLQYRPPELLLGAPATDPSVDIFSVGLVLCELLLGRTLFPGRSVFDQLALLWDALGTPVGNWADKLPDFGKLEFRNRSAKSWPEILPRSRESQGLIDFLSHSVVLNPADRATAAVLYRHEWVTSESAVSLSKDLIPEDLLPPLILTPPQYTEDFTVAKKQIGELVETRRSFLQRFDTWVSK